MNMRQSMPFYVEIAKWCVKKGNIFNWLFTVLQWNCMARSCNIDSLTWNCFKMGKDSIEIKFWDTKTDKEGKKCSPKNCYANPHNFAICNFTALACFFAIFDEKFATRRETIFLNRGTKTGTRSHAYCSSLQELFDEMGENNILMWVRPGHGKDHGFRKGAAIQCTAGTTAPPPTTAVARRGEWSLGKVFDIYWLFAEAGDHYCGRILAGLDSMSDNFDCIPPHFDTTTMSEEEKVYIKDKVKENFTNVYKMGEDENNYKHIHPILFMIFASLVHHSDALLEIATSVPSHPFLLIPILQEPNDLNKLKNLITTKPSNTINSPTGIPPHVQQNRKLNKLHELLMEDREERRNMMGNITEIVQETIEKNALNNGNLTFSAFSSALKSMQDETNKRLVEMDRKSDAKLNAIGLALQQSTNPNAVHVVDPIFQQNLTMSDNNDDFRITRMMYGYNGKMHHVPANFAFPTTGANLKKAWKLWHVGMPNFKKPDGSPAPVMPFKKIDSKFLPEGKVRNQFKGNWKPLLTKMMQAPDLPFANANPRNHQITPAVIDSTYETAFKFLQSEFTYIFTNPKFKNHKDWTVSTWNKYTKVNVIKEYGSAEDKAKLPPDTHLNKKRKRNNN